MTQQKIPEFTCILFLSISLLLVGTASAAGSADKIYKWVDQNGAIQYTQFPPPSGIEVLEVRKAPPPADDPVAERARLQQETEALDERMEERNEAAAKAEQRAKNRKIRQENCTIARKNLAELQQGGIKRYRLPDGSVLRLTEEDRQKRIAATEAEIAENCKD
jgi:hypothetical protein